MRFLIPLISGIISGHFWPQKFIVEAGPWILLLILFSFCLLLAFYTVHRLYKNKWIIGALLHCFILLTGYYSVLRTSERFDQTHFSKFKGDALLVAVNNTSRLSGNTLRFEARVLKVINRQKVIRPVTGKLLVSLEIDSADYEQLYYGQMLLLPFQFSEVEPPYNPAEFNYKSYLAGRQIFHQTFINHNRVVVLSKTGLNPLIGYATKLREQLVLKFKSYLEYPETASLASALILGYRADLSPEILNAYTKTGTMHVLSVSGMHVGIVFLVLAFVLNPLNRYKYLRLVNTSLIITVIWLYALLTGFSPSVCRAAVMISIVVLGKALNRNQNTYNLIAISAFLLLIYNPFYLFDVGFQLSYLAVLGIVFLHPKIYNVVYNRYWLPDKLWSYCALSLAAQLATFPISVYYFHQFPVYFLISNLFIVLPVIVIMYGGILFLFIPWPFILERLGPVLNSTIQSTNSLLFFIEHLPFSTVSGIWINTFQYIMIYAIIGCLLWAIRLKSSKGIVFLLCFILSFSLNKSYKTLQSARNNQIIFYSLNRNYALAYLKGSKAVVLTDIPQSSKTYSYSIDPYLDRSGITEKSYSDTVVRRKNFIKFGHYRILQVDKKFEKKTFSYPIKVDAVLISGNPDVEIAEITKYVNYVVLLIDGTNSASKISKWQKQAEKLHLEFHILKKNPAYIVKL